MHVASGNGAAVSQRPVVRLRISPPRQIGTLGAVLAVALVVTPWLLIGLLIWLLA